MDSNLEECPTGILVDFEETTITISSDCKKECNGGLSDGNAVLLKHGTEDLSLDCQTVLVNGGVHKIANGNCLGSELNNIKDEVCFSKIECRSPSPTTMNMIAREASRIVDQLHTALETSLWEEEFSLSFVSEDEYFDEASYKESSLNKMLKESCNIVEEGSCFKKGNGSDSHNLVMENSKVNVDNSVYEENKNLSQTDLTINTCVENENLVPSTDKYTTAKICKDNSSENILKIEETVSNQKNCVNECSNRNSLISVLSEENEVRCLTNKNNSVSTEKSNFFSEVESNVTNEIGIVVDLFSAENIVLTEESNIPNEVNCSSFTEKSSSALNVLNSSVSTEVDSKSSDSAKESNELMATDSIAPTEEINASNEVYGNPSNKVEFIAPNEIDGNAVNVVVGNTANEVESVAPNEVEGNAPSVVEGIAPNEVEGNASSEVEGNAPNEVEGIAPNEVEGIAPNEVEGIAPNEVEGIAPNEVESNAPNKVEGKSPNKVKSKISTADSCVLIEVESHASSNGILCASDENNFIHIRDTNGMKKLSKYSGISNTVEDGNLSVFGVHKQKLPAQTSKPNKDKCMGNTPLTIKSKFTKIFKTPSLKSPFKSKFEEKENIDKDYKQNSISENNPSKIGQMSSAKGILNASNTKGFMTLTSKSSIKTPLNKSSMGKVPLGRENKTIKVSQDEVKQKPQTFDTPLKRMNLAKFQPSSNGKTPLGKSYSLRAKTPNTGTTIRRSSSFQTHQAENAYQFKKERSFIGESRLTNFNSRMSLAQTQPIGNKLRFETPSKIGPFLPKTTTANPTAFGTPFSSKTKLLSKELQSCKPPFGSAIRTTKVPNQSVPEVVGLQRPASTTSKTRFTSRLELPSPLPKMLNDNLSRRLFPDYSTPVKRRV